MNLLKAVRSLGFVLALCGFAAPAQAWWDSEWQNRKKIVIDTAVADAAITEPIGSAVILVRLHDGDFQFGAAKEDGSDIRLVAEDDKTLLTYHLERFDQLMNEAFLWVKVPEVKPGAKTTIWLYYGNGGPKATKVEDAKATYDAQMVLVYHFAEKAGPPTDSTGKGGTAQNAGAFVTGSLIGGGTRLDGKAPLTIPVSEALAWGAGMPLTWSAWVKPSALAPGTVVFSRRDGARAFVIGLENGTPFLEINDGSEAKRAAGTAAFAINTWHHLAVVADAGKASLYVDGEQVSSLTGTMPALNTAMSLAGDTVDDAVGFAGEMDELNMAKAARPAGWIKLAALSQGAGDKAAKIIAVGADEQTSSWFSGGTFGVIIKSLTVDGWVVIVILMLMALVSWYVMYSKVSYLNAMSKGNARFMKEWTHVANDLTVLDHGEDKEKTKSLGGRIDKAGQRTMRQSSVYRIYHTGVEEIRHRLAADHNMKVLSARSIQSIRASLDGGLVREKQRIDKLIVLLTICISGGPFLGLLGTVVGVMITFAAVAAAGEVNVNAIAPGIAAALLATVAGLAVAIPALFGYNYILARVKDATADMHVFIDEFVTRMAEFYSESERPANRRPLNARPETEKHELAGAH